MLKREAKQIVGGLSKPSKMPGMAIGLPAKECKVGSKLAKVAGSVCENCYALKGNYKRYEKTIVGAQYKRLEALSHPLWVEAMTTLIKGQDVFRWHDSGDLQSPEHLEKIIQVCKATPETKHWLPTREKKIISGYKNLLPNNLVVRLSAAMVGGEPPKSGLNTSTVHKAESLTYHGYECPAYKQGGECGECRACWDNTIDNVSYKEH